MSQNQYKNQYKNQFKHQFKRPCDKPTLSCWSSSMQVFFNLLWCQEFLATPFSKVNIFKASNFPSSRVSKAIAKFPFFKGIQGQSIQLAFCIGIQGQSIKLLSFKGIQVQSITLPLLQGYQRQSIKFPFLKGIQRQRLQLPFFKGQRRTPARCPRTSPWSEGGAGESYTLVPLWHSTFWLQPLG